jgi:hypothetical protein
VELKADGRIYVLKLEAFVVTVFNKIFWGRQQRGSVKMFQPENGESVPETLEHLYTLMRPSARKDFVEDGRIFSDGTSIRRSAVPYTNECLAMGPL